MKKIILILPVLILLSCSVQKRKYQKGFYVAWKGKQDHGKEVADKRTGRLMAIHAKPYQDPPAAEVEPSVVADASEARPVLRNPHKPNIFQAADSVCDVVIFKDGREVMAKVLEIGSSEIKYKKCDMQDGPLYTVRKADIFMIKYANGSREVFKAETNPPARNNSNTQRTDYSKKATHPMAVAAIIFAFLGFYPLIGIGGILALVFGCMARQRILLRPDQYSGSGLALAGIVLGGVIVLFWAVFFLALFLL